MSDDVRLRKDAEQDLEDAADWYQRQRPGLGQDFLDEVAATLERLVDNPLMYPAVYRGLRRALIGRFPFGIFYRIAGRTVTVLAVMHGSRDPRHWKRRS